MKRGCTGKVSIAIPAKGIRVVVVAPAGGELKRDGARVQVDGIVIDFTTGARK